MKKVIVAHPGKQHSYRTATALERQGLLCEYITSVYCKKGAITSFLHKILPGKMKKKAGSHYSADLPSAHVKVICEPLGIGTLMLNKIPQLTGIYIKTNNYLNDVFGKKVAVEVKNKNAAAVISYDYNSAVLFKILKRETPDVKKILDVSIATRPFMQKTFQEDYEQTGEKALLNNYPEIWDEKNLQRVRQEIENADWFFAPSQVVKKSLVYCGAPEERIKIVPYGVDCNKFAYVQKKKIDGKLKLLFVGKVDYRKGIHHLLKVVSEFSPEKVELNLAGEYDRNDHLYIAYKDKSNIRFLGFVTRDVLANLYQDNDVFVFPTIGEGFGMVVLEALSSGLPVIISDLAGGNDAITNGEDGFEFQGRNDAELKSKIRFFLDHPNELPRMSANARKKAEKYTWERYYAGIQNAVDEILGG